MRVAQGILEELWRAQNELRDSIPYASAWRHVWALLLLKRVSDQLADSTGRGAPAAVTPKLPGKAGWASLQGRVSVLPALHDAFASIEEANPNLTGIFRWIDFNQLSGAESAVERIISRLSMLSLSDSSLGGPDVFHQIAEGFLENAAEAEGKRGGEIYTPTSLVQLAVQLADPQPEMLINDPACGLGRMLVASADYMRQNQSEFPRAFNGGNLHGQERNVSTWGVCKTNLLVHGLIDSRIELGDTLRDPRLLEDGQLIRYDRIISTLPFSIRNWGIEVAQHDRFGRFQFGVPGRGNGDYAFLQHIITTLKPNGIACVILAQGVLFRGGTDARIRRRVVDADLIEAIIGLPRNLFFGTTIAPVLMVINRTKPLDRRGRILFIDGSSTAISAPGQTTSLASDALEKIVGVFRRFEEQPSLSRAATHAEIADQAYTLAVARYVQPHSERKPAPREFSRRELRRLEEQRDVIATEIDTLFERIKNLLGSFE